MNQAVQEKPAQKRKPKETGVPDNKKYLHPLLIKNYGKWKYHDRPRPGVLRHVAHSGDQIWTVRAGTHRPDLVATMCNVTQYSGAWAVMIFPLAVVLYHQRMQILLVVRHPGFFWLALLGWLLLNCLIHFLSPQAACCFLIFWALILATSSSQPSVRTYGLVRGVETMFGSTSTSTPSRKLI